MYLTFKEYKRNRLTKTEAILWTFFWIIGSMLIIFHAFLNPLLRPLNLIRILDLYMILSFMFIFFIMFYLYSKVRRVEKRIETITRVLALKNIKKEKTIDKKNEYKNQR